MRIGGIVFAAGAFALALAPGVSGEGIVEATAATKGVSLFKNGLAMVELEVAAPAGAERLRVIPPSLPLHGSFWVTTDPAKIRVTQIVAERVEVEEKTPAATVQALLAANVGRDVVLRAGDAGAQEYRGTLVAYPGTEARDDSGIDGDAWPGEATDGAPSPGSLVVLRTYRGVVGLDPATVQSVVFEGDAETHLESTQKTKAARLVLTLEGERTGVVPIRIEYLTEGIAWAPSYRVELADGESARFEARTDVVNDLMDLEGVPARLVSGFPNLRFVHVRGALALSTTLDQFLSELASDPESSQRSPRLTAFNTQRANVAVYSNQAFEPASGLFFGAAGRGFEGEAAEDMFFTRLGELTLDKGARANLPLFAADVPCEQVFRWEISDRLNQQGSYQSRDDSADKPEEVWHSLRLTNPTPAPWTTAPITVVKAGMILGQDVSFYTAAGGKSLVKVTKALNIVAQSREVEVDRVQQAETLYGSYYDLVTIEGTLLLCSYKTHDVTVEIAKTLSGEIVEAGENPDVTKLGRGLLQVNPMNLLAWRLTLPAGKETRIVYRFRVLVRR